LIYAKTVTKLGDLTECNRFEKVNNSLIFCVAETEERCTRDITRDILGVRTRPDPALSAMHSGNTSQRTLFFSVADPESGIWCLFDPWIRDPGWSKIRIRDEQARSYFRELNHFWG
jgi:hypothetical protein